MNTRKTTKQQTACAHFRMNAAILAIFMGIAAMLALMEIAAMLALFGIRSNTGPGDSQCWPFFWDSQQCWPFFWDSQQCWPLWESQPFVVICARIDGGREW
jgi:hypothetical protein